MQKFKHNPEVRAYLAKVKREYRARKKAREVQAGQTETPLTCTTPTTGDAHNGSKQPNT